MKSPLAQLLLLTVFVGLGLWLSIRSFVGSTDDAAASIDIRSLAHLRYEAPTESNSNPVERTEPLSPAKFAEPDALPTQEELEALPTQEELDADDKLVDDEEDEEGGEDGEEEDEERDNGERLQEREGSSLSDEELSAREKARRKKLEELGLLQKPTELTIAADVSLIMPDECAGAAIAKVPAVLKFRFESPRIMGESLNVLESLVAVYRGCKQGYFTVDENPLGFEDADETLVQMRLDEVKYFFLQHNISLDIVEFPTER